MTQPYDPNKAREAAETLNEDQTPKEQAQALVDLETEELRQLLIGLLVGDLK